MNQLGSNWFPICLVMLSSMLKSFLSAWLSLWLFAAMQNLKLENFQFQSLQNQLNQINGIKLTLAKPKRRLTLLDSKHITGNISIKRDAIHKDFLQFIWLMLHKKDKNVSIKFTNDSKARLKLLSCLVHVPLNLLFGVVYDSFLCFRFCHYVARKNTGSIRKHFANKIIVMSVIFIDLWLACVVSFEAL